MMTVNGGVKALFNTTLKFKHFQGFLEPVGILIILNTIDWIKMLDGILSNGRVLGNVGRVSL